MPISIEPEFDSSVTQKEREAFNAAVNRWQRIIVEGGPLVIRVNRDTLNRRAGLAANTTIDLTALHRGTKGAADLPTKAAITLDDADMKALDDEEEQATDADAKQKLGRFREDLVAHEIGHALGFSGEIWGRKGLLNGSTFTGPSAVSEYKHGLGEMFGAAVGAGATSVPLEVFGRQGEFIAHWRQAIFHSELMTFILEDRPNNIGPVTIAALQDLGYTVDPSKAEEPKIDFTGDVSPDVPLLITVASTTGESSVKRFERKEKHPNPPHRLVRDRRWINCHVFPR